MGHRFAKLIILLVISGVIYNALYMQPGLSSTSYSKTENKEEKSSNEAFEVNSKQVNFTGINISSVCARRYILLTTQRSGSSWFCSLLSQQKGIICGGKKTKSKFEAEPLYDFQLHRFNEWSKVSWFEFSTELENAFIIACRTNPVISIGFKLMYDQIPSQLLEDDKLEKYLRKNGVSLVHLVREAKILKIASEYSSYQRSKWFADNETEALSFRRDTPKLKWTENIISDMLNLESMSQIWQRRIQFMPHVPVHYLSYEKLLATKDRVEALRQVSAFLTNQIPDSSSIRTATNVFQVHERLCSDRIENYVKFRAHDKVLESGTAAACDMLEFLSNESSLH